MAAGAVEVNITSPNAKPSALFDGVNNYINIGNVFVYGYSVCLWFKTSAAANGNLVGFTTFSAHEHMEVSVRNDGRILVMQDSNNFMYSTVAGYNDGAWHHVYVNYAYDASVNVKIYVDGVDVSGGISSSIDTPNAIANFRIGSGWVGTVQPFNGSIGEVRIWNRALTATEVNKLYGGEVSRTGLVSEWLLKDDYTDTAGSNDGTNSGTRLGTFDGPIAKVIAADRVTANDRYMIVPSAGGRQVITTVVEET